MLRTDPTGRCAPKIANANLLAYLYNQFIAEDDCTLEAGVLQGRLDWQGFGDYWRGPAGQIALVAASILLPPVGVVWGGLQFAKSLEAYQRNPTAENRLAVLVDSLLFACGGFGGSISGPRAGIQGALAWVQSAVGIGSIARIGIAVRAGLPVLLATKNDSNSQYQQGSEHNANTNPSTYQTAKDRIFNSGRPAISARFGGANPIIVPDDIQISTGGGFKVKPNVKYLYIIDEAGNLRIAEEIHPVRGVKHTQLSAEGPVYGAGEVWFDAAGKVEKINANSGRYMAQPFAYQYVQVSLDDAKELFSALGH